MKRAICIWLPEWPIQRLVVAQSELKRKRVVLFFQDPRRGRLVSAVSPLAQRDGLLINMPLSEAKSLLKRSSVSRSGAAAPDAAEPRGTKGDAVKPDFRGTKDDIDFHVFEHDRAADLAAIEELADSLSEFSPIVGFVSGTAGIEQTDWPDSIFLDVTGLAHLFGSEHKIATGQSN